MAAMIIAGTETASAVEYPPMHAPGHEAAERETHSETPEAINALILWIGNYCGRCWKNAGLPPDRWDDTTQDVLLRVLKTVERKQWPRFFEKGSDEQKEFFRAIDAAQKHVQREHTFASLSGFIDPPDTRTPADTEEWEQVKKLAEKNLSPRNRDILSLYHFGMGPKEIADQVDMTAAKVSDEKQKCIKKLRLLLHGKMTV